MEKVRIFQDMLEYLYALTPYARSFVEEHFSKLNKDWFKIYVLPESQEGVLKLDDVDLYTLLKVLIKNWNYLQAKYPKKPEFKVKGNLKLLQKVKQIRNCIAHLNESHYKNISDMDNDKSILNEFAGWLGVSLVGCKKKMLEDEKKRIQDTILEATSNKAIARKDEFNPETMQKIEETKEKLLSFATAKEVVDFLEAALENPDGQKIAEEVHSLGLPSFEDIAGEVFPMYYNLIGDK